MGEFDLEGICRSIVLAVVGVPGEPRRWSGDADSQQVMEDEELVVLIESSSLSSMHFPGKKRSSSTI